MELGQQPQVLLQFLVQLHQQVAEQVVVLVDLLDEMVALVVVEQEQITVLLDQEIHLP